MEENRSDEYESVNNVKTFNNIMNDDEPELNKQTSETDTIEAALKRVEDVFKYLLDHKNDSGMNSNETAIKGIFLCIY